MDLDIDLTSLLAKLALEAAAIIGLTEVVKKGLPESIHNKALPLVALFLGVAFVVLPAYLPEGLVTQLCVGIVLGGSATGLYAVAKAARTE